MARDLFWQNVLREILTSLSVAWLNKQDAEAERRKRHVENEAAADGNADGSEEQEAEKEDEGDDATPNLFDGRLAVLTHAGERIPIAEVFPLFACGLDGNREERWLSTAVECTVFQIRTPGGEVYTLPLHQIRAFHSLTPQLMKRLERLARKAQDREDAAAKGRGEEPGERLPFGFAAFTTLARGMPRPDTEYQPAI